MTIFSVITTLLLIATVTCIATGQTIDRSFPEDSLTIQIQKDLIDVRNLLKGLENNVVGLRNSLETLRSLQKSREDSLWSLFGDLQKELAGTKESQSDANSKIDSLSIHTGSRFTQLEKSVSKNLTVTAAGLAIIVIAYILGFMRIRKKMSVFESLLQENLKLNTELEVLLKQQHAISRNQGQPLETHQAEADLDHSLPIRFGEEIYRMRFRIANMDENTKGVTALKNSLSRLEDEFNVGGYAIKDLTGQTYVQEMTAIVKNWEPNDGIKPGEQRIVRMIKPQILYKDAVVSPGEIIVGISVSDSTHSDGREQYGTS